MTPPMTPREKVEPCYECGSTERIGTACAPCNPELTALASGSGDHAELARLAEWRDRLRADPGRAAHFGSPYADKPMQNGRTYWNIDLADDITTLLAENAALRARENELIAGHAAAVTALERKLAEAVGLLGEAASELESEVEARYDGVKDHPAMTPKYDRDMDTVTRIRTFLSSKEAEQ